MKQILIATDFSTTAQQATRYGMAMAEYLHARIKLIHAYTIPFSYTDTPMPLLNLEEVREFAESNMKTEVNGLQKEYPEIQIVYETLPGDVIEVLEECVEEEKPELVVLGTSGEGGGKTIFGSMTIKIMRNCKVPVLAVPEGVQWKPVHQICFAADYKADNPLAPVVALRQWVQLWQARLFVLHVNEPDTPTMQVPFSLRDPLEQLNPEYISETSSSLEESIHGFLARNAIDWLVIIPRRYGFFEQLFHKSRTKQLTLGSEVPVLGLHEAE